MATKVIEVAIRELLAGEHPEKVDIKKITVMTQVESVARGYLDC